MERAKNKRASRRSQSTRIVNEVNQLVQSGQFELSTLHVLHSRLKAVQTELAALNAELETFLTYEQVAEDYDSVMEYEDAATSALALLEHHMNRLKVSSPASTAHPPATTTGEDPPATSEREPTRPRLSTAANSPESSEQEMERLLKFLRIEVECRERSAQITAPQLMETRTHDSQSSRKIAPPPLAARSQLTRRAKVVTVTLRSQHDNTSVQIEAVVVPFICDDIIEAPKTNKLRAVIVAEGKPLADAVVFPSVTCEPGVSLLIGSDQLWKIMPNSSEVRWDSDNRALMAIKTSMGWTLQGPSSVEGQGEQYTSSHISVLRTDVHQTEDLSYPLPRIWELDVIGIVEESFPKQEDVVLERFTETIDFRNGREKDLLAVTHRHKTPSVAALEALHAARLAEVPVSPV
ncbi:hypothetical protein HPB52_016736 [Rhipicephalus sanguineus]|uniref:Uncharacterized protein n=1 Tax=Rhipicephalus sanguineus TaxID=34632 RepID=A0A9D4PFV4_RHISA|nr:hypothetical protein HPB52_016734 [Rhipicephalus sanguineus]KAH7939733.1 hypothetical protein HPB52_016736 [Rhipicephalus sanguineus]